MAQTNEGQRRWMINKSFASKEWWNSYREVIDADLDMTPHGRETFDENVVIGIGDEHYRGLFDRGEQVIQRIPSTASKQLRIP